MFQPFYPSPLNMKHVLGSLFILMQWSVFFLKAEHRGYSETLLCVPVYISVLKVIIIQKVTHEWSNLLTGRASPWNWKSNFRFRRFAFFFFFFLFFVAVWVSPVRGCENSWGNGLTIPGKPDANTVLSALQNELTGRRKIFLSASFIYDNLNCLDFIEERNDFLVGSFPVFCLIILMVSP